MSINPGPQELWTLVFDQGTICQLQSNPKWASKNICCCGTKLHIFTKSFLRVYHMTSSCSRTARKAQFEERLNREILIMNPSHFWGWKEIKVQLIRLLCPILFLIPCSFMWSKISRACHFKAQLLLFHRSDFSVVRAMSLHKSSWAKCSMGASSHTVLCHVCNFCGKSSLANAEWAYIDAHRVLCQKSLWQILLSKCNIDHTSGGSYFSQPGLWGLGRGVLARPGDGRDPRGGGVSGAWGGRPFVGHPGRGARGGGAFFPFQKN